MTTTRVLIFAAYASVRAGLRALLSAAEDLPVVGESSGSAEAERLLPMLQPDIILADDMPEDRERLLGLLAQGEAGLVLLGEAGLVLLGEARDGWQPLASAPLPGWAFLLKDADEGEIIGAVRAAAAGLIVLDRSLTSLLFAAPRYDAVFSTARSVGEMLTLREREVLGLMALGLPNKQIAARLTISLHTVKFHVAAILAKLGAASRTEAVTLGARRGDVIL